MCAVASTREPCSDDDASVGCEYITQIAPQAVDVRMQMLVDMAMSKCTLTSQQLHEYEAVHSKETIHSQVNDHEDTAKKNNNNKTVI